MVMKLALFDVKDYDRVSFEALLKARKLEDDIKLVFHTNKLDAKVPIDATWDAISIFVNDSADAAVLQNMAAKSVKLLLCRCAGFDRVDLVAAGKLGISVARVPAYSPEAVAEFAMLLLQSVNRNICLARNRIRDGNFALDGLEGLVMNGKTVGVVGTGRIGYAFAKIALGYGTRILAYDVYINKELEATKNVKYTDLETLLRESDFVSLHAPLTPETKYMINEKTLKLMKPHAIIANTSRGMLIDTRALLNALIKRRIAGAGVDVYENESEYFFTDHSKEIIEDDILARLQNMPNVVLTSHQAFLTKESLHSIADVTVQSALEYAQGKRGTQLKYHVPMPQ